MDDDQPVIFCIAGPAEDAYVPSFNRPCDRCGRPVAVSFTTWERTGAKYAPVVPKVYCLSHLADPDMAEVIEHGLGAGDGDPENEAFARRLSQRLRRLRRGPGWGR